jgi:hypothetical protein
MYPYFMKTHFFFWVSLWMILGGCAQETSSKEYPVDCGDQPLVGRLAIKGICMNYVIEVVSGDFNPTQVVAQWRDPGTDQVYTNAFALGSLCDFPENIQEGDTFSFVFSNSDIGNCAVCLAYRPVPEVSQAIAVCPNPTF